MRGLIGVFKGATRGQRRSSKSQHVIGSVAMLVLLFLVAQGFWLSRNTHYFRPFSVQRIWCDVCGKTGVTRDEASGYFEMCQGCFGVGYHTVRRLDDKDVICVVCEGLGRLKDRKTKEWRFCRRCGARGLMRQTEWFESLVDFATGGLEGPENQSPPANEKEDASDVR